MFLCDDQWKFWKFKYFNFETNFLKNEDLFHITGLPPFSWKHYHRKCIISIQNCHIRIEWWVQNGLIKKNGILPRTNLFFWKFCFSLRTSHKKLIDVTTTQLSIFVLFVSVEVVFNGVFFPASILKILITITFPLYKTQSIYLESKSVDWFSYNGTLGR